MAKNNIVGRKNTALDAIHTIHTRQILIETKRLNM